MEKKTFLVILISLFLVSACQIRESETQPIFTITLQTRINTNTATTSPATSTTTPETNSVSPTIPTPQPTLTPTLTPTPSNTPGRRVVLMAVGDIMLGRTIGDLIETDGPEAPFRYTADTLSSADITIGNLECPISNRGQPENKTYTFRAPPAAGNSLAYGGFDLVSLANNHILDYGPLAMQDTLNTLAKNHIHAVGAGMNEQEAYAPVFFEIDGLRLAFLAYAEIPPGLYDYLAWEAGINKPGIAWAHPERISSGVRLASEQADIVIVMVHNGYEFVHNVAKHQKDTAQLAIDSGASLVIGSHPHVLQRIETYNNGLIAYSMGNFVFDNFLFPPNYSTILKVELSPEGVESYELIDVVVQLNGVPQIMPYSIND